MKLDAHTLFVDAFALVLALAILYVVLCRFVPWFRSVL